MSNPYLTEANEAEVMALVADPRAKAKWQAEAAVYGKAVADRRIASHYDKPLNTVRAASYYW